ncbi:MAG: ATP-binding protein [Ferruginibacter sp.]
MKQFYFLIIFLSLVSVKVSAQHKEVFQLNNLPAKDTLLTGWTMYAGDSVQFANPYLDDSKWSAIDLTKDISQYPQLHQSGIIWLRLHVSVDSSLKDQVLSAHIEQYTASEVYLNGKLIQKYGTVSNDPKKVSAYLPSPQPFLINLWRDTQNVIAVRAAYEPGIPYISNLNYTLPVFNLYINSFQAAAEKYSVDEHQMKMYIILFSIFSGALLLIGFIYLVYFLFDKSKKVNLYYAVSMLAIGLNALPIEVWGAERYGDVALGMWVFYFEAIAYTIGNLFIVLTIYSLFNYPRRAVFKLLILFSVAAVIWLFTKGTVAYFAVTYLFPTIYLMEGGYVCIWAMRNHKKDAPIILIGVLVYLISCILSAFVPIDSTAAQLLFYMAQMSFPIGMSFYLGIQSSNTNNQLRTTLAEVQNLSTQNLVQEQEKQQLLANQNEVLEQQVTERTAALNESLHELKSTQSQLIQSEKMASLGELTAGIAHEIQNPLNFVNNFSEVSKELLDEMKTELNNGNTEDAKEIADDVIQNLEKINHHGKRADAIVKGMLQHSRASKGQKEPTDINALCDEYLRLSYHGIRAKDKLFNATIKTDFDSSIEKINIVQQDIGKVILNLLTNAFYAVAEKKKVTDETYEPTVSIKTFLTGSPSGVRGITISVSDNGNGIPQNIADKIFQPFFTTKPTGQGTGLGLSLSYDIIKAHGGEIKVETKNAEGATFIINLSA